MFGLWISGLWDVWSEAAQSEEVRPEVVRSVAGWSEAVNMLVWAVMDSLADGLRVFRPEVQT